MIDFDQIVNPKERKNDRILVIKTIEGKSTISSTGLVDKRLFTGDNQLHAILDPKTFLWYLKYDHGTVEQVLRQKFTSFSLLLKFVRRYYEKRNIEIVEVID